MSAPNFASGTIWTGDCLEVMRGMNSETVDLIYLDPPFNSNVNYAAPVGSAAAGAAFKDTWTLSDVDAEWINLIEQKHPAVHRVLLAAMTDSDKSYLAYMAARLLEMPRLLKPTSSIYLHCDPTMSHYLKLLMDAIFGRQNFRNELSWKRTSAHSDAKRYGRVSDRLLFYAGDDHVWNPQYLALSDDYVARDYRHSDSRGRYRFDNLTGPSHGATLGPPSTQPWRGYDPLSSARVWSAPKTGAYARFIESEFIPGYRDIEGIHDRLDALEKAGLIDWTDSGYPRLKRYLEASPGEPASDFVADIQNVNNRSHEKMSYPTQKPLALLDRIISASSNPQDMVLDPFCGCATTLVAADRLDRHWVGIDLSAKAAELVVQRVEADQGLWKNIIHRTDIPPRTDLGPLPAYNAPENKQSLYGQQGGDCAGCGTHFQPQHLTVDHIIAQSKGGTNHIENLQLLCAHCNSVKGDRGMDYLATKLQLASAG